MKCERCGGEIKDGEETNHLGRVLCDALLMQRQGETPTGTEKVERYLLAQRIHGGSATLTAEEVVLLKELVGASYIPLVVGQVWKMLDP